MTALALHQEPAFAAPGTESLLPVYRRLPVELVLDVDVAGLDLDGQRRVVEGVPLVVDLLDELRVADRLDLLAGVEEIGQSQHGHDQAEPHQKRLGLLFHAGNRFVAG